MATLMEKDVLIQFVATLYAEMYRYSGKYGHDEDELYQQHEIIVRDKRDMYYCTYESELDFKKEVAELQKIRARYKR